MALDVGNARIGVALSDPLGLTAQPLCTVEQKGGAGFKEVLALLKQHGVGTIVIGMPYELDGSLGEQGKIVEAFVKRLDKSLLADPELSGIKTEILDERFTTQQAERALIGSKLKNKQRSAAVDRVAAALILENYLLSAKSTF